jgi:hypothetical protein
MRFVEENLAAGQRCQLIDAVVDVSKPSQPIAYSLDGRRGGCVKDLQLFFDIALARARAGRDACGSEVRCHGCK